MANQIVFDELDDIFKSCPTNSVIFENYVKAFTVLRRYNNIIVSVSGGSDSDVMVDIVWRCTATRQDISVRYIFIDTGLEFAATKSHIADLEQRYGIQIERVRPYDYGGRTVLDAVRLKGQPFLNKNASEYLYRLQRHSFDFSKDGKKPFEELLQKYPSCKSALEWWCDRKGEGSRFSIKKNKFLKEFIIENPPTFKIAALCCHDSKKRVIERILNEEVKKKGRTLSVVGVRKAEGGARAGISSCFSSGTKMDIYRPIFWYSNADKEEYDEFFEISNSDCYLQYGLVRTGCCCCPFGLNLEDEKAAAAEFEPNLLKAVTNAFKESCAYTEAYKGYAKNHSGLE